MSQKQTKKAEVYNQLLGTEANTFYILWLDIITEFSPSCGCCFDFVYDIALDGQISTV